MTKLNPLPIFLPSSPMNFTAADPQGATKTATPIGIRNTEAVGVLVDRINFGSNSQSNAGYGVELRWRNEPLTNGFVTIGAITYPLNRAGEDAMTGYTLRLAKPFYLPPGESIDVRLQATYSDPNTALPWTPMAIGRQAEEPAERWVPYLAAYTGALYTAQSGAAIVERSNPPDLGNPFDVPLYIDRLVGRVLVAVNSTTYFVDGGTSAAWDDFLVRIYDHKDHGWAPVPIPLPLVFNPLDRSWVTRTALEPKGFLQMQMEGTASSTPNSGYTLLRPVVGLLGYRRIA